ncbi:MFS transporter [Aureibacter tunicatorum]|uniref:PAT family beta-lactamase induction signal transducer AmpG n=1 Tax=Aureibacter tunicatorum TaxID=866807 RepID=A0AAE4BUE4_9BACT|nr:MFS transporter [Aureibacter tunicatorum]MDR6241706.1 PAT family beta-lactamase induction signal transducer AmpG [Aureibacter tunicatorum]BDD07309.1 MFS transporter [Aureibacter tunicatorum]
MKNNTNNKSWSWIPTLYFTEGLPYILIMSVSVTMYKNLGVSNEDIAFYTSWLYLPWVIKPFWSPFVDIIKTKRWWIVTMQLFMGALFGIVAFTLTTDFYFNLSMAVLALMAFSSATHDIAADGFYIQALDSHSQSYFVGIRSTFYRVAMIFGQGFMVYLAGQLNSTFGNMKTAWMIVFLISSGILVIVGFYHKWVLPKQKAPTNNDVQGNNERASYWNAIKTFFLKDGIILSILFILSYRLGEAQLVKIISPFLLDGNEAGGMGMDNEQVGVSYGTIGVIALVIGGILGGNVIAKYGLKRCLLIMILSLNLPNALYMLLAYYMPQNDYILTIVISLEQFGYGFGFAGFLVYLMYLSQGKYQTTHYALCTGLMALGMMIPGMFSGMLQEELGYPLFFGWVLACSLPCLLLLKFLKIDPDFGRKL